MTVAEFKAYFPEFNSIDDVQIERALDLSSATISEEVLKDNYELAYKYLTAHFVYTNSKQFLGNGASVKDLSSKSVDGVSLSYKDNGVILDGLNGNLSTSSYGQMYLRLVGGSGSGGLVC